MHPEIIAVPGAVERTGGICPFDRKLRSWDCLAGDNLTAGEVTSVGIFNFFLFFN